MYVIGERINGMFEDVKKAIIEKDPEVIKDLATRQMAAGATALDVNVGPAAGDAKGAMLWLVEAIREVSDAPVVIDTAKWDVMSEVIPQVPGKKILNSSKADFEIASQYVGLAAENGAGLIGLTIDADGVPGNVEKRVELGAQLITIAMEGGIEMDDLFIDPIILPVNVAPKNPGHCMEAIAQLKGFANPAPHLVLGLSNVSQRCSNRNLINRTYLAMCISAGLDSAIMDPLDTELMDTAITAELLQEQMIYCDSYLQAARH
ncbi:MAG: dihydropteroate synthase [Phycisphaerae bacterium]|jgi:5-methyltetrahydrofolate corrinoid/iron sulfur protein methyltransferase|nr:dihydropteroate synthase [Phycisphaerae bacterium]